MPRTAQAAVVGIAYHAIKCGNVRAEVFHTQDDYGAFPKLLAEASHRLPMRLLSYCQMPNQLHLVLWPREDGDLSRWMQWLLTSCTRESVNRDRPFGSPCQSRKAKRLRLEHALRPRGKPRKA